MINPQDPSYQRILAKLQSEAHQYDVWQTVLDRACDYIWFYQCHHTTDLDAEGLIPDIQQDSLHEQIWYWVRSREGLAWLCSGRKWPTWFEKRLLVAAMYGSFDSREDME